MSLLQELLRRLRESVDRERKGVSGVTGDTDDEGKRAIHAGPVHAPEVFGHAPGLIRHAIVRTLPESDADRVELWAGDVASRAIWTREGEVVEERVLINDYYRRIDFVHRSALLREGFADLDRRIALLPVLGPAWAVTEDPESMAIVMPSGDDSGVAPSGMWFRFARPPIADMGVTELDLDDRGLPRRAVISGSEAWWIWELDEEIQLWPESKMIPTGAFIERYVSGLRESPAIQESQSVRRIADFSFQTSAMDTGARYFVLRSSAGDVEVGIGKVDGEAMDEIRGADDGYVERDGLWVQFGGSTEGTVASMREELTAAIRSAYGQMQGSALNTSAEARTDEGSVNDEGTAREQAPLQSASESQIAENIVGAKPPAIEKKEEEEKRYRSGRS